MKVVEQVVVYARKGSICKTEVILEHALLSAYPSEVIQG